MLDSVVAGDCLLFLLLGPQKSAAVLARSETGGVKSSNLQMPTVPKIPALVSGGSRTQLAPQPVPLPKMPTPAVAAGMQPDLPAPSMAPTSLDTGAIGGGYSGQGSDSGEFKAGSLLSSLMKRASFSPRTGVVDTSSGPLTIAVDGSVYDHELPGLKSLLGWRPPTSDNELPRIPLTKGAADPLVPGTDKAFAPFTGGLGGGKPIRDEIDNALTMSPAIKTHIPTALALGAAPAATGIGALLGALHGAAKARPGDGAREGARGGLVGAGTGLGASLGGAAGLAAGGVPTALLGALGGGLVGRYGSRAVLGDDEDQKYASTKRADGEPGLLDQAGEGLSQAKNWALGDAARPNALVRGAEQLGAAAGQGANRGLFGGQSGMDLHPDVNKFLDQNRWANNAAWGLPIGAGVGLLGGLLNRKKKKDALGDALSGGLMGALGGGLVGAARDVYDPAQPAATTPAEPAAPPAQIPAPAANTGLPGAKVPPIEKIKDQAGAGADKIKGQGDYNSNVRTMNSVLPMMRPENQKLVTDTDAKWQQANADAAAKIGPVNPITGSDRGFLTRQLGTPQPPDVGPELDAAWKTRNDAMRKAVLGYGPDQIQGGNFLGDFAAKNVEGANGPNIEPGESFLGRVGANQAKNVWDAQKPDLLEQLQQPNPIRPDDQPGRFRGVEGRSALGTSAAIGGGRGAYNALSNAMQGRPITGYSGETDKILRTMDGSITADNNSRGLLKRMADPLGLTKESPLAPDRASDSLIGRLTARANTGNTRDFIPASQIREELGAMGTPKATPGGPAAQGLQALRGNQNASLSISDLAKNQGFVDELLTHSGAAASAPNRVAAYKFLTTGDSGNPTMNTNLQRSMAATDGPLGGASLKGKGPSAYLGGKTLGERAGSGLRNLVGPVSPINPLNLLGGAVTSLGTRRGTNLIPPDRTVLEGIGARDLQDVLPLVPNAPSRR